MDNIISNIKDIFTIIIAVTATVISIFAFHRARATVLQPIRSEVIKKQSQLLSEILSFLPRNSLDDNIDYVGITFSNTYRVLKRYGFVIKDEIVTDEGDKALVGWLFCGEEDVIRDVEIIGMFSENPKTKHKDENQGGKELFENAKKGIIEINRIYFTARYEQFVKKLSDYADNPFLPQNMRLILNKIISDIHTNLTIHLKNTLVKFLEEFCQYYFNSENYPNVSPLGVYNEFNHVRIHHKIELMNLKAEIRNYLKIDDKW